MPVQAYRVEGYMRLRGEWQKFSTDLRGLNERSVREKILSEIGSRHRVKRGEIRLEKVTPIPIEEVESRTAKSVSEVLTSGGGN